MNSSHEIFPKKMLSPLASRGCVVAKEGRSSREQGLYNSTNIRGEKDPAESGSGSKVRPV